MTFPCRRFLHLAAAAVAVLAATSIAGAQSYPARPITMTVPFPPGGVTDSVGRIVAERMRSALGQTVVVENVGGADGSIGVARVARARPDGYTIVLGVMGTHVLNGVFYSLPYDVLNDFTPIAPLVIAPDVLFARKTMPARDFNELLGWLRANPNQASAGITTVGVRLIASFFQQETGTRVVLVPYRGIALAMQDLAAGQIDLAFETPAQLALVQAGSIKAYAVTSDTRIALALHIPTFRELGLPALSFTAWFGLFAPRGTPIDIVAKLNTAAVEALAEPSVQSRLVGLGFDVFPRERQTPEALGALVKADTEKWWPIIKSSGIKAE
jgi:tripartite-type tricarboxylate transporter receptor subunit TctC